MSDKVPRSIPERLTITSTIVNIPNVKHVETSTPHEKLRQRIKSKRLTRLDAAARLNVSPSYLSEILNGRTPGMGVAAKIQREFGLPMIEWIPPGD